MRATANLGQILGIHIRLQYRWFIVFVFITSIIVTHYPEAFAFWQRIILGIFASLLFFVAVCIREFAINFLAISRGMRLQPITLFIFGGVSRVVEESATPVLELMVSMTGLLSNLIIAGMFYIVHSILVNAGNIVIDGFIQWLAYIFFMLALFHFIPGFPLDGGRFLRAILWKYTGNYYLATRITSWIGQGVGLISIIGGILLLVISQQWIIGITLILVGWALHSAAVYCHSQTVLHEALRGINARDLVTKECPPITGNLSIRQLIWDCILVTGQRYFVIADDNGELQGAITMRSIRAVPKNRWSTTHVSEIMMPANRLKSIGSQEAAVRVLEEMDESGMDQMPVIEEDKVIGFVTRSSLLRLAKTRAELKT